MRSDIWTSWLKSIDSLFRASGQHILLLVDNAPSHIVKLTSDQQADSSLEVNSEQEDLLLSDHSESDNENQTENSSIQSQKQRQSQEQRKTSKRARIRSQYDVLGLTHVTVQFLPPNTTAHIQPMDAGIIKSFKAKYKHLYCQHILQLFEENKDIEK